MKALRLLVATLISGSGVRGFRSWGFWVSRFAGIFVSWIEHAFEFLPRLSGIGLWNLGSEDSLPARVEGSRP